MISLKLKKFTDVGRTINNGFYHYIGEDLTARHYGAPGHSVIKVKARKAAGSDVWEDRLNFLMIYNEADIYDKTPVVELDLPNDLPDGYQYVTEDY